MASHAALSAAYIRHWQDWPDWDINPDGKRSNDQGRDTESAPNEVNVVLNWFEEMKNRRTGTEAIK